ncbi:MAG: hypothetical protein IJI98_00625 [Methanosphaera sp.]|nr:hypothetical protein [Methanosphaera sp.]
MLNLTYDKKVHIEKWNIDVIPYLTIDEMTNIINDLLNCNNGLERDLRLIADILVACTDLYNDKEDVHYTYEDILYSGLWYDILDACPILRSNIDTIYREVGDTLSLNRSLMYLIDSATHIVESVDVEKLDLSKLDVKSINQIIKNIVKKIGE